MKQLSMLMLQILSMTEGEASKMWIELCQHLILELLEKPKSRDKFNGGGYHERSYKFNVIEDHK